MASLSKTTRTPKRLEVNQRALVDKVLARYPEEFTVFRELLQNADDARAKKVLLEFQTKDYATHPAGANGINGTTPGLAHNEGELGVVLPSELLMLSIPTAVQMSCSQQW
ncbi:uncharacterized protein F5891DRAFT_146977 [Suillus fuscotomentosus]|uniref:Sacsin/Nov domain-containing protein n=1 Tax=Suillus fuscotomentosus TaxID=1912939 RepID=A0AAD4HN27_9AGAM|nr:uncharacterized protein F5891DRAFT_146977 [Suillus fuscotomentosus]KAG1902668.1 hypothetical protein F5891DRAFT_146977 [Suillus fuscotomentosus]